jgi:hypothetical protein
MASTSTVNFDFDTDFTMATADKPIMYFDEKGNGPNYHVCPGFRAAAGWLDRQRLLGLISPEGAAAVERLIEDLG